MTLKSTLAAVPARVTAGTEYEQSIVRLVVGAVLFLYLLPQAFITHGKTDLLFLVAMVCYLVLASVIFSWIHLSPSTSPARRVCTEILDVGAVTFFTVSFGNALLVNVQVTSSP